MSNKGTTQQQRAKTVTNFVNLYEKKSGSTAVVAGAIEKKKLSNTPVRSGALEKKPRSTPKSTTLNACFTPSSLYRNATCTPTRKIKITRDTPASVVKTPKIREECSVNQQHEKDVEASHLNVAVRIRPLNTQECSCARVSNVVQVQGTELTIFSGVTADTSAGVTHSFNFDNIFNSSDPENDEYANQEQVFNGTAKPLIDGVFEGYNACLFAYGQTGSGKSYSMMGIEALDDNAASDSVPHSDAGIIPRFCRELFNRLKAMNHVRAEVEISYFEIYNEKIHDLLTVERITSSLSSATTPQKSNIRPALKVREHPIWGPYVVDLSVHPIDSYEALRNWLAVGNSQRATAATGMNEKSSRSHSIFNIVLNLNILDPNSSKEIHQTRRSRISLVDLAGSERITGVGNGDRIREGVSINKSLLTLGKVIAALADTKKNNASAATFVPYRESVLTWLLRENLGGNSKTVMLATISPANVNIEETLATLRYACQARSIVNRVKVNEAPHDKIIRELRAEVDRLKSLKNEYERQRRLSANSNPAPRKIIIETSVDDSEVEALKQQLSDREKELNRAQKSWMERLKEAEKQRQSEVRLLQRKGLALELSKDQKHACLINLTDDPILSGTLFYILPLGQVKIGRTRTSTYCSQPDIVLDGPLVAYHHCMIENINGQLYITPENKDFETYVNGDLVNERQKIYHGDRLVIGGLHYFRVSNPFCSKRSSNMVIDFQMAHDEILRRQEEKLRRELEEEKRIALSKIESERAENEKNFIEKMQRLDLEQFKYKCNREILETERQALQQQSRPNKSTKDTLVTQMPSYQSRLLENIKNIMLKPSEESLHKTQIMVKEATQRCRSFGRKVEFHHTQKLDEFGMFHTVILLKDNENMQKAEWPVARLGVWLDIIRSNEDLCGDDIFKCVDIIWEPIDNKENEPLDESLNTSGISLNFSVVQDALVRKAFTNNQKKLLLTVPKSKAMKSPTIKMKAQGSDKKAVNESGDIEQQNEGEDFARIALSHLGDMQRASLNLKLLCGRPQKNQFTQKEIDTQKMQYKLAQVDNILEELRTDLEQNG